MDPAPRDPALRDLLDTGAESAIVAKQGAWILIASAASAGLGLLFWILAARFFRPEDVGVVYSLASLSALATAIATLGLDIGFVRFAPRVRNPLRLLRELATITGGLGAIVGGSLAFIVLAVSHVEPASMTALVGISIFLTVATCWNDLINGAIMAAQKSHILALAIFAYSGLKIVALLALIAAGALGLFAAYSVPMLAILIIYFATLPKLWPRENLSGTPHSVRQLASLSFGNWISSFVYSLPVRLGPALMLIFLDPASVAYFFIALQLAEVVNYVSEAFSKSLYAHGSRQDRLTKALTARMRRLVAVILIPIVVVGIVVARFALSIFGSSEYQAHALALQLFLIATIPKAYYQILRAEFNVERRPIALIATGGTLGISTLAFLLVGLAFRVEVDLLAVAWILGGVLGLAVGQVLAGTKRPMRVESADIR